MLECQLLIPAFLLVTFIRQSSQHGYLEWPPQRSSLWRFNYDTPPNYNDNALWCGGIARFKESGGKCGPCGDPYYGPRDNEAGGKFALGIIVAKYPEMTRMIDVTVKLNALHKGYMEFKICPHNNPSVPVRQSCLDQYPVRIKQGVPETGFRMYYPTKEGSLNLTLVLPRGLSCSQCVLQWVYKAGNSWGTDEAGHSCLGCGIQEQFQNCADISIGYDALPAPTPTFHPRPDMTTGIHGNDHHPSKSPPRDVFFPPSLDEKIPSDSLIITRHMGSGRPSSGRNRHVGSGRRTDILPDISRDRTSHSDRRLERLGVAVTLPPTRQPMANNHQGPRERFAVSRGRFAVPRGRSQFRRSRQNHSDRLQLSSRRRNFDSSSLQNVKSSQIQRRPSSGSSRRRMSILNRRRARPPRSRSRLSNSFIGQVFNLLSGLAERRVTGRQVGRSAVQSLFTRVAGRMEGLPQFL